MEQLYTQCTLRRINTEQKAWIPAELAKVGNYLKIRGVNGWKVISKGRTMPDSYFKRYGRDYKSQREASDI